MAKFVLQEVTTAAERKEFLKFGRTPYAEYPHFVSPLDNDIESVFDPAKNKMFSGGEAVRWLVRSTDGHVLGRIAAFYNRAQSDMEEQPTGGCGFFESVDDPEVAGMLFDAARDWLKGKGMEAMDGPVNFGSRDMWWGLLVDGFDSDPLYGNPYNPPYYKALFEQYGFREYFNQHTLRRNLDTDNVNPSIAARVQRLENEGGYRFEHISKTELDTVPERFRIIYNRAWSNFTGVKPMEREEVEVLFRTLRPIIDPRLIYFAYHHDEPIGFFVMIPDLNRVVKSFGGRFGPVEQLRLVLALRSGKCDRIFAMIFGVAPEFQRRGVEAGMMDAFRRTLCSEKMPYTEMELAWIGDFNPVMLRVAEQYVGATRVKRHTTYRYLFDRTKEFHRCPRLKMQNS